jgi:pyruvate/2-oxoglutarate dehydrogenase complex dihydrolipoamide dehydrogenase (E3) component
MDTPRFDAIVIGSGQGGTPLASKLAKAGWKTALIEKADIGGTCINRGCTPTKTMIADARLAQNARDAPARGIMVPGFSIDLSRIMARKNEVVASFRDGSEKRLTETANLTLLRGEAVFTGPKTLTVGSSAYTADKIFINVGCNPFVPPIPGLGDIPYLTSTTLLDITEIPAHLVVVGGGYIALELGQLFRRLGSEVTLIERGDALLSKEDTDIQEAMAGIMADEGIKILVGTAVDKVSKASDGSISVEVTRQGQQQNIKGSHLLLAIGRKPQTKALQLEKTGVTIDKNGYISVDEYLQTSVPGIYAIGDVKGGPAFTHISYNDYVILYKNLLNNGKESTRGRVVPYCVFTDPQLGRIGITEKEASDKGLSFEVARLPMTHVARAIETGHTKGLMKAIVDKTSGQILGAAVLGDEGGEIMTVLQMAMTGGIGYDRLKDMVFAHPLFSESLNNLFMTLEHD